MMNLSVLIVPYDSGICRARMGAGPEHLLEAGLKAPLNRLGHIVEVDVITLNDPHLAEIKTAFVLNAEVARRVAAIRAANRFPIVLSGNCNIAVGAISGCGIATTGMFWFDAHGEATTPDTTPSGFLDGMGISILTGQAWCKLARSIPGFDPVPGSRVILAGARDFSDGETDLLDRVGVARASTLDDVQRQVPILASQIDGVYVHLDLDGLDPAEAVWNGWPTPAGWTIEAVQRSIDVIRQHTHIVGFGFGSYDPSMDGDGRSLKAAAAIVESLLGAH